MEKIHTHVDVKSIVDPLNKCYLEYAEWPVAVGEHDKMLAAFRYHLEANAGLRIAFAPETDKFGRAGWGVKQVEVIDEHLYLLWTLRWA